jgi:hypothetical protein
VPLQIAGKNLSHLRRMMGRGGSSSPFDSAQGGPHVIRVVSNDIAAIEDGAQWLEEGGRSLWEEEADLVVEEHAALVVWKVFEDAPFEFASVV